MIDRPPTFMLTIIAILSAFASTPRQSPTAKDHLAPPEASVQGEDQEKPNKADKTNAYLPPSHWSNHDLIDFVLSAQDKPRSIRKRDAFVSAVCSTCDRILGSKDLKPSHRRIAILAKTHALQFHASWDNEESDKKLELVINELSSDEELSKIKQVSEEVKFLNLERKLIDAAQPSEAEIGTLLKEAHAYVETHDLSERHLRLASNVVRVINLLDSKDEKQKDKMLRARNMWYVKFGESFSQSAEIRLARYGKNLVANLTRQPKDLLGKHIPFSGACLDGSVFDSQRQKGCWIIVDFWATWCSPCRKEMPNLRTYYKQLQENQPKPKVILVGANLDTTLDDVNEFVEEHEITWPQMAGPQASKIAESFSVSNIPTYVVIDPTGAVTAVSNTLADARKAIGKPANRP